MLDLKTGKFVIDAEKGWEVHPFMTREEFQKSGLFNSEYLIKNEKFNLDDPFFGFKPINIDGYEMYVCIYIGGRHDCVRRIELASVESYEFGSSHYDETWEKRAFDIKRMHDEFLMREIGLEKANIDSEKRENWYSVEWGDFQSSICLRYEPDISIAINYRNLTEKDIEELDRLIEEDDDL